MANIKLERWPWEEQEAQASPYDYPLTPDRPEERGFFRGVGDVATQLAAGIPYAARGVVGLAGMIPGVNAIADPLAEGLGQAGQYIEESLLSDYAQRQRQELAARQAQEEGFLGQAGATLDYLSENPSMIPGAVAQSIPSMFGGGLIGAGIRRGAQSLGLARTGAMTPLTTGAVGEGAMIAGTTAAEIASQNPEDFAARYYGLPAGIGGAAVSLASGRLLGASDIDTMIAQRLTRNQLATGEAKDMLTFTPGMAGRVARGAVGEGLLEEAPQSAMEQVAVNLGTNQDPFANLGGDVAMGAVTGAFMGAGAGVGRPRNTYTRQELARAQQIAADETIEPRTRLEALDFIRRIEIGQLGPEQAQERFAAQTTTPFESGQFTPFESGQFSSWQSPRDILAGQGLEQVETGGLVAPGIRQTGQGIYMMEPAQGGVAGGLGPRQMAALAGPPTGRARLQETQPRPVSGGLGLQQQQTLAGPGPRPVSDELGPQQQIALAGPGPRPVVGELGTQQQAALAGPQLTPPKGTPVATLPAAPAAGLSTPKKPAKSKGVIASAAKVEPLSAAEVDEVGKILGDLEAKVATEPGKAEGRVTLPQGVLAGVMRTIRSLKSLTPVVYQPKTANVDVAQTNQYSEQMNAIRDATKNVIARAEALFNAQSNVVPSDSKAAIKAPKGMTADAVAAVKAQEVANKLVPLQQELSNAIDNLRTAAGNDRNVEALVAVLKGRAQKQAMKPLAQAKQDTKVDTLLSRAWAMYKDGALNSAEGLDIVRGRETRVSREVEAKGATEQPLVAAAEEGYARRILRPKRGETAEQYEQRVEAAKESGVLGMLAYIQRHGTGFERLIASSVARALRNPQLAAPKYEWIAANETPRYNPKTNTVYVHRTASPEQTLHETLHAALQWYVYQNPNSAEVLRLDRALQKVLDYKGDMSPKAKEVIDTLRKVAKGRSKTARLDAILELISYGTTLNDFRQVLKSLETAETPEQRGLLSGMTDLWRRVTALVQKFLGVSNTAANDVLDATIALLEQASTAEQVGKRTGNVLQSAVGTDTVKSIEPAQGRRNFVKFMGALGVTSILPSPKAYAADFGKLLRSGNPTKALEHVAKSSSNPAYRQLARRLLALDPAKSNIRMMVVDPGVTYKEDIPGSLNRSYGVAKLTRKDQRATVYLRGDVGLNEETFLHEMIHASLMARYDLLNYYTTNPDLQIAKADPAIKLYVEVWEEFRSAVSKEFPGNKLNDAPTGVRQAYNDPDEFITYALTNESLQKWMQSKRYQGKTLWGKFVEFVKGTLGFGGTTPSWLDAALRVSNNLLDTAVQDRPDYAVSDMVLAKTGRRDAGLRAAMEGTNEQVAKDSGYPNFQAYKDSPGGSFNPTRQFFEKLGFGQAGYSTNKIREAGKRAADKIRKDFPTLERYMLAINSRFSNPPGLDKIIEFFKSKQNTGILEMEKITEYLQRAPKDAEAVLNYLDGDTKALDGIKHKEALKAIADNVMRHLKMYIEDLPEGSKERKLFESLKFTEYLLNPDSVAQLAGKSFGMKKLSTLLGLQRRSEASIEDFKDLLPKNAAGDVDLNAPLYQVFETKPNAEGNLERMPWGFISKEMADKNPPAGLDIDFSRVWRTEKFSDEGYSFISRTTTPAAVREMAKKQEVDKLSAALLNTMSALSHNYASRYYFNGLSGFGREGNTAEGKATAQTVAFNNVEEINEVFAKATGRTIDTDNLLKVSDEASKMKDIRKTTQRTGTWVQLPDTETYGQLAGKIIPGPVWNSMLDMHDRNPLFNWQALNTTMTFFKKAKTVYTPATHVNNILTNYSLMLLHGIPHSALKDAASLFIRFETNPKSLNKEQIATMQAFYASGAVLGQFTTTEAKQTIANALADNISPDSKSSFLTTLADLAKVEKGLIQKARSFGNNADTFMTNTYAAGDNIFRLAAFLNTAGNIQFRDKTKALSQDQLEEAGIAARKMFLDYDIDARAVRAARQSFMPFISWSYAIMPVLGRIAIEKPWAMVNMMAALAVMSAVMGGEDDDEIRREGPESLRQKTFGVPHYIRIPFMGDAENPVYYNIGKSIPMMTLFQPSPQEAKFAGQTWIPGFLNPSGPYASLIAGAFFGIDPFTGKQISQPTDTQWDKLVNTGQSVYNTLAPSFAQTRFADQAKAIAEGRVGPTGNETNALFLARTLGGMSLYQFNRDESRFYQELEVKKIKRDFSTAMNRSKREELRKGYPDYEALDKDLEDLRKRMDKALDDLIGQDDSAFLDL